MTRPPPGTVPASLAHRIEQALGVEAASAADPRVQTSAAAACLEAALRQGADRGAALDLLACDALLTSACGAAADLPGGIAGVVADSLARLSPLSRPGPGS